MFEFIYSKAIAKGYKKIIKRQYDKKADLIPLLWTEHCIECAAPTCYATCKRYKRRSDENRRANRSNSQSTLRGYS